MNELEMSTTLGILIDPEQNRLTVTSEIRESIERVSQAFSEMSDQKKLFGTVNQDLWLEFIPWHSIN